MEHHGSQLPEVEKVLRVLCASVYNYKFTLRHPIPWPSTHTTFRLPYTLAHSHMHTLALECILCMNVDSVCAAEHLNPQSHTPDL